MKANLETFVLHQRTVLVFDISLWPMLVLRSFLRPPPHPSRLKNRVAQIPLYISLVTAES